MWNPEVTAKPAMDKSPIQLLSMSIIIALVLSKSGLIDTWPPKKDFLTSVKFLNSWHVTSAITSIYP